MKLQLNNDIDESVDTESDESNFLENSFSADEIQRKLEIRAHREAEKIIRKNRKEIKRLKEHAGECIINDNFEGYSYAIKKLRKFYKQKYNDDLILSMWKSSRAAMFDIIESAQSKT